MLYKSTSYPLTMLVEELGADQSDYPTCRGLLYGRTRKFVTCSTLSIAATLADFYFSGKRELG